MASSSRYDPKAGLDRVGREGEMTRVCRGQTDRRVDARRLHRDRRLGRGAADIQVGLADADAEVLLKLAPVLML